jgi:hypothetical protein
MDPDSLCLWLGCLATADILLRGRLQALGARQTSSGRLPHRRVSLVVVRMMLGVSPPTAHYPCPRRLSHTDVPNMHTHTTHPP